MAAEILYDKIGSGYNITRRADEFIANILYGLLSPAYNGLYLDIGCGTGNYTIELAKKGLKFYGVEPAEEMLVPARDKCREVTWLNGSAERIPVDDLKFDGAIATLTIHHWTDINLAFAELCRVLKNTSRLVVFTATPAQMRNYWLNHYFPEMMERSIKQMPSFNTIEHSAAKVGFEIIATEKYLIQDNLNDLFLYAGKNKPEIYLDADVRKGISSFADPANYPEAEAGIKRLESDIYSGKFKNIKSCYNGSSGDYLFIVMEKRIY